MKSLLKSVAVLVLSSLVFFYGCEKNPASPDDNGESNLTDTEKMIIVGAEVAQSNGGINSDLEMVHSAAAGDMGALLKTAGFDTTVTIDWVTLQVSLKYYSDNGVEQPTYIPTKTDKIVYKSTATGSYTSTLQKKEITLNSGANLEVAAILSGIAEINGSWANNSSYLLTNAGVILALKSQSKYEAHGIKMDLGSSSPFPTSGKVIATIKGNVSKTGTANDKNFDYEFQVTIEFTGDSVVIITLPSGKQFSLNLETGEFQRI